MMDVCLSIATAALMMDRYSSVMMDDGHDVASVVGISSFLLLPDSLLGSR
jgi:hypothetical protein